MWSLVRWFWHRQQQSGPLRVTLYTRQGCHLCDDALAMLQQFQKTYPHSLSLIDIDSAPELIALYGDKVPVIAVGSRPRLWGRINKVLLERLLHAQTRASS